MTLEEHHHLMELVFKNGFVDTMYNDLSWIDDCYFHKIHNDYLLALNMLLYYLDIDKIDHIIKEKENG